MKKSSTGKIYLVGAGPGDPDLITRRGWELIHRADSLVVDALANPEIYKDAPGRIFDAGKRGIPIKAGGYTKTLQPDINQLLKKLAWKGDMVVRLKGGDPIVFGRGGEEMSFLKRNKIPYEVVPGVSSPIAASAYAGIPISDRTLSSQVIFLTGRERKKSQSRVDWDNLPSNSTLMILMGVNQWPEISRRLLESDWPSSIPVAAIESATLPKQRVLTSTLGGSLYDFRKEKLVPPAVIVVGKVARLGKDLGWVKNQKPLWGKTFVITRPEAQAGELREGLKDLGARVILCPAIRIRPLLTPAQLQTRYSDIFHSNSTTHWLVFLSANGVETFSDAVSPFRSLLGNPKVCAVGPKTAQAALARGWKVSLQPEKFDSFHLTKAMGNLKNKTVVIPRGLGSPKNVVLKIEKKGARVKELFTYENIPASPPRPHILDSVSSGVEGIVFTSGSTVKNFLAFFPKSRRRKLFKKSKAISIGPVTTKVLRENGVRNVVQAKEATSREILHIIKRKFGNR